MAVSVPARALRQGLMARTEVAAVPAKLEMRMAVPVRMGVITAVAAVAALQLPTASVAAVVDRREMASGCLGPAQPGRVVLARQAALLAQHIPMRPAEWRTRQAKIRRVLMA